MADSTIMVDGADYLVMGMDSYTNPQKLGNGFYSEAMNIIARGGMPKTRPGTNTVLTPPDGNFQGVVLFKPTAGSPYIVFAVDGIVYASASPFNQYVRLYNIQFNPLAKQITWAVCLKSTFFNGAGEIEFLENPYSVLVMQDGFTRAAYWDGGTNGHLNPTVGVPDYIDGFTETPVGLWMKWSNNRLWVSRGNQIFASDIGNPLKFTEAQYLNEGRAFYLPDECTGITETSDQQGIIAFTAETGTFLNSSIQDRTLWLSTPSFQKTILTNVGCVSGRSIVNQYGLIWWYSAKGLINLDDALSTNITSKLSVQDNQMFSTKYNLSYDLSGICGTFHENFLLESVPFGGNLNTRTLVLDQAPIEAQPGVSLNAWASYWSGWNPIEWASAAIDGQDRIFFGSTIRDNDGVFHNSIWEAFVQSHTDNGCPITCFMSTKEHLFDNRDNKQFYYAEVEMREIVGHVAVMIAAAGVKGAFQKVSEKLVVATNGQIYSDEEYGVDDHPFTGTRGQYRIVTSIDTPNPSDCNSECVETPSYGLIDRAFSIMVSWSGSAAISAYRIFARGLPVDHKGKCEDNEDSPRVISESGCSALGLFADTQAFDRFDAEATYTATNEETYETATCTESAFSFISQEDADIKAECAARLCANSQVGLQ